MFVERTKELHIVEGNNPLTPGNRIKRSTVEHSWGEDYAESFPWTSIREANQNQSSTHERTWDAKQPEARKGKSYEQEATYEEEATYDLDNSDTERRLSEENNLVAEPKHHLSHLNQLGLGAFQDQKAGSFLSQKAGYLNPADIYQVQPNHHYQVPSNDEITKDVFNLNHGLADIELFKGSSSFGSAQEIPQTNMENDEVPSISDGLQPLPTLFNSPFNVHPATNPINSLGGLHELSQTNPNVASPNPFSRPFNQPTQHNVPSPDHFLGNSDSAPNQFP